MKNWPRTFDSSVQFRQFVFVGLIYLSADWMFTTQVHFWLNVIVLLIIISWAIA